MANNKKPYNKGNKSEDKKDKDIKNGVRQEDRGAPAPNENKRGGKGTGRYQDPFWYAKDEKAIQNMANFPFLEVVGRNVGTDDYVPGIAILKYRQTIGFHDNDSGYATRAAQSYFQYLTQGFTGDVPFEAADLLFTALAGSSLITAMIAGKRAYGLMKYYLQFNPNYAKTVVEALGFNFDDLNASMAKFRTQYNIRVEQINRTIAVPKGFFICDRWEYINSFLFTDTESEDYSTVMAFVCTHYLKYDATTAKTGTCLRWAAPNNTQGLSTVEQWFAFIDELIGALTDDDVRSIFGAVRRVYAPDNLKKLGELEVDFLTSIVKNDIVNAQIHNMQWCASTPYGWLSDQLATNEKVHKDVVCFQNASGEIGAVIACKPSLPGDAYFNNMEDVMLDMYDHLVSPNNILDITACMAVRDPGGATYTIDSIPCKGWNCRSEVYTAFELRGYGRDPIPVPNAVQPSGSSNISILSKLSHLDSHPLILINDGTTFAIQGFLGELDKYTRISQGQLAKLHQQCFYQLLAMPANTKSVT